MEANKFSSAGLIKELIDALPKGGSISFDEIWQEHLVRGYNPDKKRNVYASVQQEATKGTIGRGVEKQTYCKHNEVSEYKPLIREPNNGQPATANVGLTARTRQLKNKYIDREEVYMFLTEKLGPAVKIPKDIGTRRFLLVGDKTGQYILDKYETSEKRKATHWCKYESALEPKYYHVGLFVKEDSNN
jgi:hypothetical protein